MYLPGHMERDFSHHGYGNTSRARWPALKAALACSVCCDKAVASLSPVPRMAGARKVIRACPVLLRSSTPQARIPLEPWINSLPAPALSCTRDRAVDFQCKHLQTTCRADMESGRTPTTLPSRSARPFLGPIGSAPFVNSCGLAFTRVDVFPPHPICHRRRTWEKCLYG